jgi:RNA polymerase sigma factor (sigma-70 family)
VCEDLTHDIFLAISNHECKYSGDTDVQGYLCGIAKRLASNNSRKEAMQQMGFGKSLFEEIACLKSDEPSENLNIKDIRTSLFEAISRLPEKSRKAVELVLIYNLRPYQAAQKAGCSPEAFRSRLSCGLNILRRKLVNFPKKVEL